MSVLAASAALVLAAPHGRGLLGLFALVRGSEYLFLPPVCLAIALVTSAAHREDMRSILRHAVRSWIVLMAGILAFMVAISYLFEWILPG